MGELTDIATGWMDRHWDGDAGLLWNMPGAYDEIAAPRTIHLVAQSAWYAAALLLRGAPGDEARAASVVGALLDCQYDDPGTEWHGTFARFLETPHPQPGAVMWVDYDPNWRQFVGTTFELLLQPGQAGQLLDASLRSRMRAAVELAVAGEPPDRVPPSYSNIALMRAWLEVEHGRPGALEYARAVVDEFDRHGTFAEYNSPTYYGIDLYALALWREHSSSSELRDWGARIEGALWHDVARWYHAGLANLCGPWSRSYGMDMRRYVSLLGLWMRCAFGSAGDERVPFPDVDDRMEHGHDFALAALVEHLGPRIPTSAMDPLRGFEGEHTVSQVIATSPSRTAGGWLTDTLMLGAEDGELTASARGQFHPATAHWQTPSGDVGWLRLWHDGPARATVRPGILDITCLPHRRRGPQPPALRFYAPGGGVPVDGPWNLDGVDVTVSVSPQTVVASDNGEWTATFPRETTRIQLEFSTTL